MQRLTMLDSTMIAVQSTVSQISTSVKGTHSVATAATPRASMDRAGLALRWRSAKTRVSSTSKAR